MVHALDWHGWHNRRHRYPRGGNALFHYDLMDQIGDEGAARNIKLTDVAASLGLPGKYGVSGGDVGELAKAGEFGTIATYCAEDVLQTWLVYLRWSMSFGRRGTEELANRLWDEIIAWAGGQEFFREFLQRLAALERGEPGETLSPKPTTACKGCEHELNELCLAPENPEEHFSVSKWVSHYRGGATKPQICPIDELLKAVEPSLPVIHCLDGGRAVCDVVTGLPVDWPAGNEWVGRDLWPKNAGELEKLLAEHHQAVLCPRCCAIAGDPYGEEKPDVD